MMTATIAHRHDTLNAFVTSAGQDGKAEDNPWLILDRSDQQTDTNVPTDQSNQHWIAYDPDPSKRVRVVFEKIGKNNQGQDVFAWASAVQGQGLTRVWSSINGTFGFTALDDYKNAHNIQ